MTLTPGPSLGSSLFAKTSAPTLTFGTPAVTTPAFSFGTAKTTATSGLYKMKVEKDSPMRCTICAVVTICNQILLNT